MLAAELVAIDKRRRYLQNPALREQLEQESTAPPPAEDVAVAHAALQEIADQKTQRLNALQMHLSGLAISGGGIRSATFALGLLQGLAELELLKRFDYISTVSGGGYIGGWLAAWTKREGDIANVHQQLRPGATTRARPTVPLCPKAQAASSTKSPSRSTTSVPTAVTSPHAPDSSHPTPGR